MTMTDRAGTRPLDTQAFVREHELFGGQATAGQIAPYVLVPGSKARVRRFAEHWDTRQLVADYREFLVYTGTFGGVPVSACSTGIGGTSVAVAVQELVALGAHTFLRVGVTGTLQAYVKVGDVTIASGAIRRDRVSDFFLAPAIPAVAAPDVVLALAAACQRLGFGHHVGVTATTGTFYCGEGRPGFGGYTQSWMDQIVPDLQRSGVLDWDTETATLFAVAQALGCRAGRINGVVDSAFSSEVDPRAEGRAVDTALRAILLLAEWDQAAPDAALPQRLPLPVSGRA